MLSYVLSSASTYFYLPIDDDHEEEDHLLESDPPRYLTWAVASEQSPPLASSSSAATHSSPVSPTERKLVVEEILSNDDLYKILGIHKAAILDKIALRRAYLARSKACHPDKFPNNPDATYAFQRVAVAYDVLSKPSSKRLYDTRSPSSPYDFFAARPSDHAEETFRSVMVGIFNDFLDGDLEVIRTLLRAINDINPSIRMGDGGIDSVLSTLQSIREQALTCRRCIYALHAELARLLEVQHAFRQLSYFDLMGRSRLTIQLTRITLSLPIALEHAVKNQSEYITHDGKDKLKGAILPRQVRLLIHGADVVLERMERILK